MKPLPVSCTALRFSRAALGAAACLAFAHLAQAGGPATITKDNNVTAMNDGSSWVGGTAPGPGDIASFNNTINPITTAIPFGADTSWAGITATDAVQGGTAGTNAVVLGNTTGTAVNLTIGSSGINMASATTPLGIGASIIIGANQTWSVAAANEGIASPAPNAPPFPANSLLSGSSINPFGLNAPIGLLFSGVGAAAGVANQIPFNLGGFTVNTTGAGSIMLHSGFNVTNGTINIGNGAGGPVFYNGFSNFGNTFIMQSGGTHNASVAADVTFNVATSLRFQSNSGSMTSNGVINLGQDEFGAPVDGAILGLVTASTGANVTTLAGPLNVVGNSILTVSNQPQTGTGGASNANVTISGNISGAGNLTVANSANQATNQFLILSGNNSGYSGTFNLTTGTTVFPSGTPARKARMTTATAGSAAATWNIDTLNTLQVNGVTVQLGTLTGGGNISGSAVNSAIEVGAGNFSGILGANLSLNKVGAANSTLLLSGASPAFVGSTTITSGALGVSGNISGSAVVVTSFGTLAGNGTVGAVTTQPGGVIEPGLSALGILTAQSVNWAGSTDGSDTFGFDLSNTDSTSDGLSIIGAFTKGSGTTFKFDFGNTGNALGGPTIYTLISFTTTDFVAGDLSYTGLASGLTGTFNFSPNFLTFSVANAVPEPAEWAALFGAVALLAALRRRRAGA